jgi:hypothetical protein
MTLPNIVAFCGPKNAGKDSAALTLQSQYRFQLCPMASFLNTAVGSLFMLSHDQLYGNQKDQIDPRWNVTPSQIIQAVGTDLLRNKLKEVLPDIDLGPDGSSIHCKTMRLWLESSNGGGQRKVVIPDVQFKDESDLVHSLGGKIIRITRDSDLKIEANLKIESDFSIENNGSLRDLNRKVIQTMNQIDPKPNQWIAAAPILGMRLKNTNHIPTIEDMENGELIIGKQRKRKIDSDLEREVKSPKIEDTQMETRE